MSESLPLKDNKQIKMDFLGLVSKHPLSRPNTGLTDEARDIAGLIEGNTPTHQTKPNTRSLAIGTEKHMKQEDVLILHKQECSRNGHKK